MLNFKKYYSDPFYRNSIAIMINSALSALTGLLFWIIVARYTSSYNVGIASTSISIITFIVFLSKFGMDIGLMRYLPNSNNKSGLYYSIIITSAILSQMLALIFLLGINYLSPSLSFLANSDYIIIFLSLILVNSIYTLQNTVFIALRRADLSLVQNIFLTLRIPIIIIIGSLGLISVYISFIVAFSTSLIFGLYLLKHYSFLLKPNFDVSQLITTFTFSIGNYISSIFLTIPTTIIPIMIINILGGEESAYFFIAYSIANLLMMIPGAIATSLLVEGSNNIPLKENVKKSLQFSFILLVPGIIVIFLFGDKVLLLFSKEYSEQSFNILKILALSSLFSAIISIYISIKNVQKNVRTVMYLTSIVSVLIIIGGYALLLIYGLTGIGYAYLFSNMIVSAIVLTIIVIKEKWIKKSDFIK